MAKKKASAKQTKKNSPKKAVKKATPKKKIAMKKAAPKAASKKVASKKAPAKKKAAPKAKAKAPAKKVVKKAPAKPAKKPAVKSAAKPAAMPAAQHLVKAKAPVKELDLSNFVTPLDDRLIVQLSGAEKMTAGGLYIPDTVADTSGNLEGTVVAVGRGHFSKKGHLRPMDVKLGDKIVFSEYSGSKIKIQNEDLIILRESDVMGVVAK